MTELLVVILIIVILSSILVPVVSKIRAQAHKASTMAQMNTLQGAIQAYYDTFGAYPGPLRDEEMYNGFAGLPPSRRIAWGDPNDTTPAVTAMPASHQVTMSENLFLGLVGGLRPVPGRLYYGLSNVGMGPQVLAPLSASSPPPKIYKPFLENWRAQIAPPTIPGKDVVGSHDYFFTDDRGGADPANAACLDSSIPEFVDRFPDYLPIIYARARVGADGVISDVTDGNSLAQYDVRQYQQYMAGPINVPPTQMQPLRIWSKLQATAPLDTGLNKQPPWFGLWVKGSFVEVTDPNLKLADTRYGKPTSNDAYPYFIDPTNPGALPRTNPRSRDTYILISAGIDRIYGTADDIVTFGSVIP